MIEELSPSRFGADAGIRLDALVGNFGRSENDSEEIDIAGVEIHPTAAGERIAKLVFDRLGWQLSSGKQRQIGNKRHDKIFYRLADLNAGF